MTQAFIIGEKFNGDDSVCLVLGDNIFYGAGLNQMLHQAVVDAEHNNKAAVFGYRVSDPERYGVAEFYEQGNCLSIEEKPEHPKSNYAVVGLYFYPNMVVEVAKHISNSLEVKMSYTITVDKNDISLTKRLKHPAKNFRLDYTFESSSKIKIFGQLFGTELKQTDFMTSYNLPNSVSLESFEWLLPDNGAVVVTYI